MKSLILSHRSWSNCKQESVILSMNYEINKIIVRTHFILNQLLLVHAYRIHRSIRQYKNATELAGIITEYCHSKPEIYLIEE